MTYALYLMSQILNISFAGPQLKSRIDRYSGPGTRQEKGVCILHLKTDFPPLWHHREQEVIGMEKKNSLKP